MTSTGSYRARRVLRWIAVASALLLAACSPSETPAPTAPPLPAFTGEFPTGYANFPDESSVLSVTGERPCGWNRKAGDKLSDNRWCVEATPEIFALTLDPLEGPLYEGALQGRQLSCSQPIRALSGSHPEVIACPLPAGAAGSIVRARRSI